MYKTVKCKWEFVTAFSDRPRPWNAGHFLNNCGSSCALQSVPIVRISGARFGLSDTVTGSAANFIAVPDSAFVDMVSRNNAQFISPFNPMVTICTASLTFNNSTFCPHSVFVCFVWIWEQTAIISLYSINWLVCITETECVYCAVRTGSLKYILS